MTKVIPPRCPEPHSLAGFKVKGLPTQDHRASLWQALSSLPRTTGLAYRRLYPKSSCCCQLCLACIPAHLSQPLASSLASSSLQLVAFLSSCPSESGRADVNCSVRGHIQREGTQDKHCRKTLFIASLLGSKSAMSSHGNCSGPPL